MAKSFRDIFDSEINLSLKMGLNALKDFPQSAGALLSIAALQPKMQKRRKELEKEGVIMPPLLIISATERCNLRCAGCYMSENLSSPTQEMTKPQMENLLSQAVKAGCSMILLAGGEPLLCKDWLDALADRPEMLGLVFTNGTLLDAECIAWFSKHRNLLPLISIEGDGQDTDNRRGGGVSETIETAMKDLKKAAIPFGLSITTGGHNIHKVTDVDFITPFTELGCRLIIHVEYVPMDDSGGLNVLSEEEKKLLSDYCLRKTDENKAVFISFPGDEERFGGCLAAGRGFAHISAAGCLEPCPFAQYSDTNVCEVSLEQALKSALFRTIRQNSQLLHEGMGGCALRGQGELLNKLVADSKVNS